MHTPSAIMLRGAEADAALHDPDFIARWQALLPRCPYATVFQRPEFVRPWYSTYRREWEPILLVAREASGDLAGFWPLAWNEDRQALTHAGAHQAEYHAWLAAAGREASFLEGAWGQLRRNLPFTRLSFDYLPNTGLADLLRATLGTVAIRRQRRPLLKLDPAAIQASFSKKSNKSRFNRLKRLGTLEFRRVVDLDEFERVFDELIDFYDFRQGATYRVTPFRKDLLKRHFHLRLFTAAPERVLLTVTYLAGRPIAAYWGLASEEQTHLGMLIHSPFLAEHSPGKVHLMQLSEYLLQLGMRRIDLTPGGDAWKERFANEHDEVASAVLHVSRWQWRIAASRALAIRGAKRILPITGVTPHRARSALIQLRRATPFALLRRARTWIWDRRAIRVYRADRPLALRHDEDPRVRRNSLADLMLFQASDSSPTRDEFLSAALTRLEQGESAWTVRLEGRLAHCGWTAAVSEWRMMEGDQVLRLPPGSVVLHDVYSASEPGTQNSYGIAIGHMLRAAFADETRCQAYVLLPAEDRSSRRAIEAMGLRHEGSFYWQRRLGRVSQWVDPPGSKALLTATPVPGSTGA
jgi:CelD/BcsL family acetyltransferase involved in cellulose biosynthesis